MQIFCISLPSFCTSVHRQRQQRRHFNQPFLVLWLSQKGHLRREILCELFQAHKPMFKIVSYPYILLVDLCSWEAFCFHGFWMLIEKPFGYCCIAVRLHCWLLTTRLSGVLSSLSLVHCVVLDFCLHDSPQQIGWVSDCLCESADTPCFTCTSHGLLKGEWRPPIFFDLPDQKWGTRSSKIWALTQKTEPAGYVLT